MQSNSANGFMGFRIYFVSKTRLSLQIKSKLIFLTATPAHPAGVCEASCILLKAGDNGGAATACQWLVWLQPSARRPATVFLLDPICARDQEDRSEEIILFLKGEKKTRLCDLKDWSAELEEPNAQGSFQWRVKELRATGVSKVKRAPQGSCEILVYMNHKKGMACCFVGGDCRSHNFSSTLPYFYLLRAQSWYIVYT